jgi:DNA-binding MarR family transcriptional regulator
MKKPKLSIAEMADILHQASMLYMASSNIPVDYGTGEKYTAVEVHMLKYIIENPGKTVTELAQDFDRTKAAISLMLKKMEQKEIIEHRPSPDSLRKQLYYATEKGLALNKSHLKYDERVFGKTIGYMEELSTEAEILECFTTLKSFIRARRRKHYRSPQDISGTLKK